MRWRCQIGGDRRIALAVPTRLHRVEFGVAAVRGHEFLMGAALYDDAILKHQDIIRHAHGRESMRDYESRLTGNQLSETLEEVVLSLGIQRSGRLIENYERGIAHEAARQRNLLPLPAGKLQSRLRIGG